MRRTLVSSILLVAASLLPLHAAEPNQLTKEEQQQGWKLLFNGSNLDGWKIYGSNDAPGKGWRVEKDGTLKKVAGQYGGNIITTQTFHDFELSWHWAISEKGNNGVKYLVSESRPSAPGPEYQMLDDDRHPDSKIGPQRRTGALYDIIPPSDKKRLKPVGEWNHSRIIVRGNKVEHWLNGEKIVSYQLGSPSLEKLIGKSKFKNEKDFGEKIDGHIMLTDHSDGCSFRDIKIREIKP